MKKTGNNGGSNPQPSTSQINKDKEAVLEPIAPSDEISTDKEVPICFEVPFPNMQSVVAINGNAQLSLNSIAHHDNQKLKRFMDRNFPEADYIGIMFIINFPENVVSIMRDVGWCIDALLPLVDRFTFALGVQCTASQDSKLQKASLDNLKEVIEREFRDRAARLYKNSPLRLIDVELWQPEPSAPEESQELEVAPKAASVRPANEQAHSTYLRCSFQARRFRSDTQRRRGANDSQIDPTW